MFHFNIWVNEDTLDIWNIVSSLRQGYKRCMCMSHIKCPAALYCWSFCLWNACGIPGRQSRTWSLHIEDGAFIALVLHKTPSCSGVHSVSLPRAQQCWHTASMSYTWQWRLLHAVCPAWCTEVWEEQGDAKGTLPSLPAPSCICSLYSY